jgi:hypothetical protein
MGRADKLFMTSDWYDSFLSRRAHLFKQVKTTHRPSMLALLVRLARQCNLSRLLCNSTANTEHSTIINSNSYKGQRRSRNELERLISVCYLFVAVSLWSAPVSRLLLDGNEKPEGEKKDTLLATLPVSLAFC